MWPSMGIGPDTPPTRPTFSATNQKYKGLELEIVTDLANIMGGEYVEMLGEEASSLLERFEPIFSKVLEFVEGQGSYRTIE
jgi:hypothetical protein